MEITVVIDDTMLEEPVKRAVANAVAQTVRIVVDRTVAEYKNDIEEAVEKYLDKHIKDEELKKLINNEVISRLADRISDLE